MDRVHELYEMHVDCCNPPVNVSCSLVWHCRPHVGTRYPRSPHLVAWHTHTHFLLHRYLYELPEPIYCRGITSGFVVVAPLSFPPRWQMPHIFSCQHFHKYCIKLAHFMHIMIITFKCLKLLLYQVDKCIWGFTGFVVYYIRPHLNCLGGLVLLCFTSCHVNQHLILLST